MRYSSERADEHWQQGKGILRTPRPGGTALRALLRSLEDAPKCNVCGGDTAAMCVGICQACLQGSVFAKCTNSTQHSFGSLKRSYSGSMRSCRLRLRAGQGGGGAQFCGLPRGQMEQQLARAASAGPLRHSSAI